VKYLESFLQSFFKKKISRKNFLKLGLGFLAFIGLGNPNDKIYAALNKAESSSGRIKKGIKGKHDLVIAKGEDPYLITAKAVEAMGGMEQFVKKGSVVLIKPNIGWDRSPEQAANTNPEVVAALIDLCLKAGAKRVNLFDATCNEPRRCYYNSEVQKIAQEHGANVFFPDRWNTLKAKFKYESPMEDWPIFREAIECDTFINVPIAKHHGLTRLTLSMKNLMGVCSGNRGQIHHRIGRKLVDLTDFINPDLTVIDAYRVLLRNGPQGGNLADVEKKNTVIIGTDPTLSDTFTCKLMNHDPFSVPYVKEAASRKFGNFNLDKADILRIQA